MRRWTRAQARFSDDTSTDSLSGTTGPLTRGKRNNSGSDPEFRFSFPQRVSAAVRRRVPADVHGGGGPDAARHRDAGDRREPRRLARHVVDCGRLSARRGDHRAGVWAPRRSARTAECAALGARRLCARLGRVRGGAVAAAARRGARAAGPGRRRADGAVASADRRARAAARAAALPGILRHRLHRRQHRRAGARRHRRVAYQLAVAVRRQSAARRVRGVAPLAIAARPRACRRAARSRSARPCALRNRRGERALLVHLGRPSFLARLGGERRAGNDGGGGARRSLLA